MAAVATNVSVDEPPEPLTRRRAAIAEALRRSAPPRGSRVGAMAAYHMGWTDESGAAVVAGAGKLLRPSLAIWATEACGGSAAEGMPAAVAVEWVHNFTLIHDDIQDGDRHRRHRPTVWAVWGAAQGINAGDGLQALAQLQLLRPGPHPGRRLRAAQALTRATADVIEGQCLDLHLEGRLAGSRTAIYLRLAHLKTGALFGAALEAGALLGGAAVETARRMRRCGRLLGAAFQVHDDWLGAWGDPALTGKARGADLARRKVTYPMVAAYAAAPAAGRRELLRLFSSLAGGAEERLAELLIELRAPERTATVAQELAADAVETLERCGLEGAWTAEFAELADYAVSRRR